MIGSIDSIDLNHFTHCHPSSTLSECGEEGEVGIVAFIPSSFFCTQAVGDETNPRSHYVPPSE